MATGPLGLPLAGRAPRGLAPQGCHWPGRHLWVQVALPPLVGGGQEQQGVAPTGPGAGPFSGEATWKEGLGPGLTSPPPETRSAGHPAQVGDRQRTPRCRQALDNNGEHGGAARGLSARRPSRPA